MTTSLDTIKLARAVTEYNARASSKANRIANVLVAIVVGALLAWALLVWLTPCDGAALCAAPAIAVRPGLLSRLKYRLRAVYIRALIASAEQDLAWTERESELLPHQMELVRLHLSALRVELIDAELAQRTN